MDCLDRCFERRQTTAAHLDCCCWENTSRGPYLQSGARGGPEAAPRPRGVGATGLGLGLFCSQIQAESFYHQKSNRIKHMLSGGGGLNSTHCVNGHPSRSPDPAPRDRPRCSSERTVREVQSVCSLVKRDPPAGPGLHCARTRSVSGLSGPGLSLLLGFLPELGLAATFRSTKIPRKLEASVRNSARLETSVE